MKIALLTGAKKSKRLPEKNYKMLIDKELCRYTFEFVKNLLKKLEHISFKNLSYIYRTCY